MSKIKLFSLYLLFIYIKQKDGKRVSIINLMLILKFLFCKFRARVVPENILKKQARDAKLLKALKESREAAKKARAESRKAAYANAEKYHKEYQAADEAVVAARRQAKASGSFYVEGEPKVAFVIRIKG